MATKKAQIYDSGDNKFSTTTLSTIGLSIASILTNAEETANQYIFVQSFTTTQNEILASLEKASGQKWEVEKIDSKEQTRSAQQALKEGNEGAIYTLIVVAIYAGTTGQDFQVEGKLANDLLGLPKENLNDVIATIVKG